LLALAFLLRFQYAPAIAVLVLHACWRDWSRLAPLALGGAAVLALGGLVDAAHGALPFGWLAANVEQNLVHGRAAEFGTTPAGTYGLWLWYVWSLAIVPLSLAIYRGYRRAPILFWIALASIASQSLIGHKEYRFVFLSTALLIILAALGSVDWIPRQKLVSRRSAALLVAGGWLAISAVLAASGPMPTLWMRGVGAAHLASQLKADPQMCGLALYDVPFFLLPGRSRLVGTAPLYALYSTDPLISGRQAGATHAASAGFNRILAYRSAEQQLPANFTMRGCDIASGALLCIFAREGACNSDQASGFTLNDVLKRVNL
jgi:hypothetical protein